METEEDFNYSSQSVLRTFVPLSDVKSQTVATTCFERVICRHGVPSVLHSDRWTQFLFSLSAYCWASQYWAHTVLSCSMPSPYRTILDDALTAFELLNTPMLSLIWRHRDGLQYGHWDTQSEKCPSVHMYHPVVTPATTANLWDPVYMWSNAYPYKFWVIILPFSYLSFHIHVACTANSLVIISSRHLNINMYISSLSCQLPLVI